MPYNKIFSDTYYKHESILLVILLFLLINRHSLKNKGELIMLSVMTLIYLAVTYFLTGESQPLYLLPAMAVDAVVLYQLNKQ